MSSNLTPGIASEQGFSTASVGRTDGGFTPARTYARATSAEFIDEFDVAPQVRDLVRRYADLAVRPEEERSLQRDHGRRRYDELGDEPPSAGATRDMLGVLRQLFGDGERGSFASMVAILQRHANPHTPAGRRLLADLSAFETARRGVL